jgi:hypothetical protein
MAWDSATDTFWYLERNSATLVNISPAGVVLASFPHPARPYQDGVINYGLAVAGERNVLYLSAAGRHDYDITKLIEVSRRGTLTGVEIPVGGHDYDKVRGFALEAEGGGFVTSASAGEVSDLVLYRAFDRVAPVSALACAPAGTRVGLSWVNGEAYDAIAIYRGGIEAASLAGAETSWLDPAPAPAANLYRVVGRRGGFAGPGAVCEASPEREFLRGDVEENDVLNITDAVAILAFLFIGGTAPACPDAADVNDSGEINITDPLVLLNFLFLAGPPPAAPFPRRELDPTADALACPAGG